MIRTTAQITERIALTADVFEIHLSFAETFEFHAGQYVMLDLGNVKRAYSLAGYANGQGILVVKEIPDGAGSPKLCREIPLAQDIPVMVPLGHFVLKDTDAPKFFIGTGTGFAPVYCQMIASLEARPDQRATFVFGVRTPSDLFYLGKLEALRTLHPNLSVVLYLSREESESTRKGYVTDYLKSEELPSDAEFYLCGSPAMVKDARATLEERGFQKAQIAFEQF